jgi:hypothetical protein
VKKELKIGIHIACYIFVFIVGIAIGMSGNSSTPTATATDDKPKPTVTTTVTAPAPAPVTETIIETAKPEAPATTESSTTNEISDGNYLVGTDIPAGTWKTDGPSSSDILDSCYVERAKDDSGEFDSIISNDNLTGPSRITPKKGETLKLSGGCTWKLQPKKK